nr:DNA-processing protein DprA [Candidatus Gracilibacteria bacterium]
MLYLVALHSIGISQRKLSVIFEKSENYKEFYEKINFSNLKSFFNEKEIEKILERKLQIDLNKINKIIHEKNVEIITIKDEKYPKLLKEIANPPYFLYVRGQIDNSPKIAVIGSRKMTSYGENAIGKIIPTLSKYFTIVSGGAMGCDSEAHIETIKNEGKTLAIIGTGIDIDYPTFNKKLYDEIIKKGGGIISIFPLGEPGNVYNFPIRNEIISGLSVGVLVIEAQEKSGTLITVNLALEQGKDIFSIPGDIFRTNSLGCNNLLKNGNAKMVTCSEDILEEYNINTLNTSQKTEKISFVNELESIIYETLLLESFSVDDLMKKLNLGLTDLSVNLSMLEIRGIIKKGEGGKYEVS